ncbi:DUF4428 domain-containing protein [Oscillibacter valericigenes]|nr:DUF4428 domain-containing protein [Oscillibacter valericigenes]
MGNQKLEDGNLCKDCAKQLSPWFSDRRRSTVEDIKRQLAYREENRGRASQFRTTRSYGEDCKVLLDEEHRWFTVTRARDLADANPDILDCTALTGCRVDIDESRTEQKREGPDGKEVTYNPPRYEYSYDFEVIISVNNPYFDEMKFRLNNSSVYIEPQNTMQRPMMGQQGMMGQRPMAGRSQSGMTQRPMMGQMNSVGRMNTMAAGFDPESNREYRKYREMGDEIRAALLQVMETARGGGTVQTAPMQQEAPMQQQETFAPAPAAAGPWTCPACGGQNDGKFCEYCGAPRG